MADGIIGGSEATRPRVFNQVTMTSREVVGAFGRMHVAIAQLDVVRAVLSDPSFFERDFWGPSEAHRGEVAVRLNAGSRFSRAENPVLLQSTPFGFNVSQQFRGMATSEIDATPDGYRFVDHWHVDDMGGTDVRAPQELVDDFRNIGRMHDFATLSGHAFDFVLKQL